MIHNIRLMSAASAALIGLSSFGGVSADFPNDSEPSVTQNEQQDLLKRDCRQIVLVSVGVDPNYQEADKLEALKTYQAEKRLKQAILCELADQHYAVAQPFKLRVVITSFRFRSGANATFNGIFAGKDKMDVQVFVNNPAGDWDFREDTSVALGGLLAGSSDYRINRVVTKISRNVVKRVAEKGFLRQVSAAKST